MASATAIYKYNPREYSPEERRATFVARSGLLDDVLEELRARADAPTNQHLLVIGPRGIGKTNFLLMIRDGVEGAPELARTYLPVQTAEEEYSVTSLRDFVGRILEILAERRKDDGIALRHQEMSEDPDDERSAERGISALREFCKVEGKKLLLLVDNLDLLLGDHLDDDAQLGRLRDLLMNESFLVLIGAAPTYFREVSGYDRPFYNFFRPIELDDLSPEDITELLKLHARLDGNDDLLARMDELEPWIRAIHHLTGGSPRLVLMLYQLCTTSGELPGVQRAVRTLLDEVTPYYKHRIEALPAQQRKILDTFARLGRPATPTEIAHETRLPPNQVSSNLQRLRDLGFVAVARQARRRKTYYVVSERVFRIWHQMRFSASSRRLEFLIEFLRVWYTPQEWKSETERLLSSYVTSRKEAGSLQTSSWGLALADIVRLKEGAEREALLASAAEKMRRAAATAPSDEDRSDATARAAWIILQGCADAVRARDESRALESFSMAVQGLSAVAADLRSEIVLSFFFPLTRAENARLLGLLLALAEPSFTLELGVLEPFVRAVEYWTGGENEEVLDRLNPEIREIVEVLIGRKEAPHLSSIPS